MPTNPVLLQTKNVCLGASLVASCKKVNDSTALIIRHQKMANLLLGSYDAFGDQASSEATQVRDQIFEQVKASARICEDIQQAHKQMLNSRIEDLLEKMTEDNAGLSPSEAPWLDWKTGNSGGGANASSQQLEQRGDHSVSMRRMAQEMTQCNKVLRGNLKGMCEIVRDIVACMRDLVKLILTPEQLGTLERMLGK